MTTSPTSTEFDRAVRLAERTDEQGAYDAELDAGWRVGMGVNGGMLLALLGAALRRTCAGPGHGDPLSISAYYLSASVPGPAGVHVDVLRGGRTVTTAAARLLQHEESGSPVERIRALATYGDLSALPDDVRTSATPPDMPPPEECVSTALAPASIRESAAFLQRLDLRLDPATAGFGIGKPSGQGLIQGWLRLADGREPDPLMLLLAVDALPPVTFDFGIYGWAPTLELTAHVRAAPAPGWLRVRHATRNFAGGLLEEDAEVWDTAGRLVAQSRQLARARLPKS